MILQLMLTQSEIETLLEINRNPNSLNIQNKVLPSILKELEKNGYFVKTPPIATTDSKLIFHYLLTEKGKEVIENIEYEF